MTPTFRFKCTHCGEITPVELVKEKEWRGDMYPPETVETICGERWDGCGEVHTLERVNGDSE